MKYVAMLRGVMPTRPNMRNEKLRGVMEGLGFKDVATVIASGNIVFESGARDARKIEARIEKAWPEQLGFESTTIVRSRDQLADLVASEPFGDRSDTKQTALQITFLKETPKVHLDLPHTTQPGCTVIGMDDHAMFSVVDLTSTGTPELMRWLERTVGKQITTRTWKTVNRILSKMT